MAKWQDKLTEDELKHVKEWVGETLAEFEQKRKEISDIKDRALTLGVILNEPCWVCRDIAHKLGIE
jgi:hypothetical protein